MWTDNPTNRLELFDRFVVAIATGLPVLAGRKDGGTDQIDLETNDKRAGAVIRLAALLVEKRMHYLEYLKKGDGVDWDEWIRATPKSSVGAEP